MKKFIIFLKDSFVILSVIGMFTTLFIALVQKLSM